MINSRDIRTLHPRVAELCRQFQRICERETGAKILITSTYRDHASQAALYAQGRTTPGMKVTNAKPGQSLHNYRVAFDWAPMLHGKLQYDNAALIQRCGELAESIGLEWAGRWKRFPERVHCQFTDGLTLTDFQKGKTLGA